MSIAKFRVVAPMGVTLPVGCVAAMTAKQIEPRAHALEPVELIDDDLGLVRVTSPTSFKRGEVLGFGEAEMPKLQATAFEPEGEATEDHAAAVPGGAAKVGKAARTKKPKAP